MTTPRKRNSPQVKPELLSPTTMTLEEAAVALGRGRSTVFELLKEGKLVRLCLPRQTLVTRDSINQYLSSFLPTNPVKSKK